MQRLFNRRKTNKGEQNITAEKPIEITSEKFIELERLKYERLILNSEGSQIGNRAIHKKGINKNRNRGIKRRIYLASSWKNKGLVRYLAIILRADGHEVFDFTDPENKIGKNEKFVFGPETWEAYGGKPAEKFDWIEFLDWEPSKKAFNSDKAGLDWADTVILVVPSGRSSHLEAGYGAGSGKDLFIYGDLPIGEFDAMYGFAKGLYRSKDIAKLIAELKGIGREYRTWK